VSSQSQPLAGWRIAHLTTNRSACSSTDWIEAVSEVIRASASDRATEGARARSAVTRAYSYEAWLPTWLNAVLGEQVRYPATRRERVTVQPSGMLSDGQVALGAEVGSRGRP
jgi:hypothetical protein